MVLRLLAVLLAGALFAAPVCAEEIYEDQDLAYLHHPAKVNVTYSVDQKGDLTLRFVSYPALVSCSNITEMPLEITFDTEAADITIDDFKFTPAPATTQKRCVSTMKAATASVKITADELTANDIHQLRLWYQDTTLDTLYVTRSGYAIDLRGPKKPKFFFLDETTENDAAHIAAAAPVTKGNDAPPAPANDKPAAAEKVTPAQSENAVRLSVASTDKIAGEEDAIKKVAISRGLTPTADPYVFIDAGGQFALQLKFTKETPIGAMEHDGKKFPIIARLAK